MPNPEKIPLIGNYIRAVTPEDRSEIPFVGNFFEAHNAVIEFKEYNCFPHWTVWIRSAVRPAGRFYVGLLLFGMDDLIRGYFRPGGRQLGLRGGTRGARRDRRPNRRAPGRVRWSTFPARILRFIPWLLPNVGNELGKRIPGARLVRMRKVGGVQAWIWRQDLKLQRAAFWWMVADLGAEFVTNWTSNIMESEECQEHHDGIIDLELENVLFVSDGIWTQVTNWKVNEIQGHRVWENARIRLTEFQKADVLLQGEAGVGIIQEPSMLHFGLTTEPFPFNKEPGLASGLDDDDPPSERAAVWSIAGPGNYAIMVRIDTNALTASLREAQLQVQIDTVTPE